MSECSDKESLVVGDGVCGVNGNTKVFMADQSATTCSENKEVDGDNYGLYEGILPTTTELVKKKCIDLPSILTWLHVWRGSGGSSVSESA